MTQRDERTEMWKEIAQLVEDLRWPPISGPDDNPINVKLRVRAADTLERLSAQAEPDMWSSLAFLPRR